MKIFVIHSGCDYDEVNNLIINIKNNVNKINILLLKKGLPFMWKFDALNKIKKADLILLVVGKKSYQSKYINWELRNAISLQKEITIYKLNDENKLPDSIYTKDEFSDERINCYQEYFKNSYNNLIKFLNDIDKKYQLI